MSSRSLELPSKAVTQKNKMIAWIVTIKNQSRVGLLTTGIILSNLRDATASVTTKTRKRQDAIRLHRNMQTAAGRSCPG